MEVAAKLPQKIYCQLFAVSMAYRPMTGPIITVKNTKPSHIVTPMWRYLLGINSLADGLVCVHDSERSGKAYGIETNAI